MIVPLSATPAIAWLTDTASLPSEGPWATSICGVESQGRPLSTLSLPMRIAAGRL
ncbi:hypothetical protein D3C81_2316200 [compost metagenome]